MTGAPQGSDPDPGSANGHGEPRPELMPETEWRRREVMFLARQVVEWRDTVLSPSKLAQLADAIEQLDEAVRAASVPGPDVEQPGDGIDPTIASGYRLEDIRGYSPRDLGFGADGHSDEQAGGEQP